MDSGIQFYTLIVFFKVIELPVKHPELFESLGIDQPKVWMMHSDWLCV